MLVKCPKCRYRFETVANEGLTELQCVCPRCGTPFTYRIETEEENTEDHATYNNVGTSAAGVRDAVEASHPQESENAPWHSSVSVAKADDLEPLQSNESEERMSPPPFVPRKLSRSAFFADLFHQMSKRRLIAVGIAVVVVVVFIGQCFFGGEQEQTMGVADDNDTSQVEGMSYNDGQTAIPYDDKQPEETPPSWVQGTWKVETDYGGITVRIHGRHISETSAGETSRGTFRCQNHRLYCDFGDGETFVYRLDMEQRRIDAGSGLLMKKR